MFLECVTPAKTNAFVRSHLDHMCSLLGLKMSECTLQLEETWAANRARWWVVITNPQFGEIAVPPLPGPGRFVVQDLIPYVIDWPTSEQDQLLLTDTERAVFQKYGPPRKFAVKMSSKLPTALHSWGGQAIGCACGCRQAGFSSQLLDDRGLYAQLFQVVSPANDQQWRHLHAKEVSLLNGLPPMLNWSNNQRLNLAAAGQMASPLQSAWIGASAIKQIFGFLGEEWVEPLACVNRLKQLVMTQANMLFPTMPSSVQSDVSLIKLSYQDDLGKAFDIKVDPKTTVQQLLEAELSLLLLDDPDWAIVDGVTGWPLELGSMVAGRSLALTQYKGGTSEQSTPTIEEQATESELVKAILAPHLCGSDLIDETNNQGFSSAAMMLPTSHLTELVPPHVTDPKVSVAFRSQLVQSQARFDTLTNQGGIYGDDEIVWHLEQLCRKVPSTALLDPLLTIGWISHPLSSQATQWLLDHPCKVVVTAIWIQGHWTPIVWDASGSQMEVYTWGYPNDNLAELNALHLSLCQAFDKPTFVVHHCIRSFCLSDLCGAATIAFVKFRLKLGSLPEDQMTLQSMHEGFRESFVVHIHSQEFTPRPWCWGSGLFDVTLGLVSLLQEKGVPQNVASSRAKLILQSLGKDSVAHALEGGSPWKSLKALANNHSPPVRLVLQDELAQKAQQPKHAPKKSKQSNVKPAVVRPADLDPNKLVLEPGTFVDTTGQPMPQIPLSHVGPLATGVALASLNDAQSFLRAGNLLTHGSLALLILHPAEELPTALLWNTVRFAAKCSANFEPLLLTGALVQLGKSPVAFNTNGQPPLAQVEVACARITVYQDQWEGSWEDFQARPVKLVLNKLLPLTVCRTDGCSCAGWHTNADSEIATPLLDVFKRQFFTDAGRPVDWSKASYYAFSIRYHKDQESKLLKCSGFGGIFIEPKTEDASGPDSSYQVVWLPQQDFAMVKHKAQCEPASIGLARNGGRFGIRVPLKHFQEVFSSLKPSSLFLAPGPRTSWFCGPWPFGVDRKTIAKVFKEWKWDARPTQPSSTVPGGMMWSVQAITDPPNAVVTMPHGQVVVTKQREKDISGDGGYPPVVGQHATVNLCKAQSSGQDQPDPWSIRDPWQNFVPQSDPKPVTPPVHLAEMEARLEKSLLAKLPVDRMDDDGQEQRLQALEHQMQQMAHRQTSLETTVNEHQVHSAAQVQQLQSQMMNQLESQGRQMQSLFEAQTNKLEAILAKKGRYE